MKNKGILIRFDDIAENMNWHLMDKCEYLFEKYNIKPVVGIIPCNRDSELLSYPKRENFWEIVRKWKSKNWEIAMHGYTHIYDSTTNKKDYFNYGGKSEFFGHSINDQVNKIKEGLKIFNDNQIKVRVFFAPNHTYDQNTFEALKICGINQVIDGYGLIPYEENNIKFIPQLFYKLIALPYGIQTTQIHLNYWREKHFSKFENFIEKNLSRIINYDQALSKINNSFYSKILNTSVKNILKTKRVLFN
tara:strand:+ start:4862 stop:5602 length:741 start_codon:yes stop_codon:yes gene_type:complete